jgi:hypothetical protein
LLILPQIGVLHAGVHMHDQGGIPGFTRMRGGTFFDLGAVPFF